MENINNEWLNLEYLSNNNKKIINNYFINKKGTFIIDNNILYINFDNWGIEKFYINNNNDNSLKKKIYYIKYNNFKNIFNIAISIQIGNWDTFLKMENYLNNFNIININIYFIIIDELSIKSNIDYIINKYRDIVIISTENRGMDIGLFLVNLHYIKSKGYIHNYLFKIHTKTNDEFRNNSLNSLMGSYDIIINNIKNMCKPNIGMISGNVIYKYNECKDSFLSNMYHLENLIKYLYSNIEHDKMEFSGGTIFIVKPEVFNILDIKTIENLYNKLNNYETLDYYWYSVFYNLDINNKEEIYNHYHNNLETNYPNNLLRSIEVNDCGLRDCMIEHAVERLFGYICKKNNMDIHPGLI